MSWLLPSLPSLWAKPEPPVAAESNGDDKATANGNGSRKPDVSVGVEEDEEEDLDVPPPFPLPDSYQRSAAPITTAMAPPPPPAFALAPPSPTRSDRDATPPSDLNIAILPDAVPLGDMAPPPSTTTKPAFGIKPGGGMPPPTVSISSSSSSPSSLAPAQTPAADVKQVLTKEKKKRGKVALGPGCSALDWARLAKSGADLRGTGSMVPLRVTMAELQKHKTPDDAWSVFNGIVYNLTPYLRFHPGGEEELMRVAGRDGTKLFMLTHSWVNMEHLMAECAVGMLVRG